jgi:hypothetical protein
MENQKVVRVYEDGYRYGILCKSGTKYDHVVVMGCPIDRVLYPVDEVCFQELDYPVDGARAKFLDAATRLGITERALDLLKGER